MSKLALSKFILNLFHTSRIHSLHILYLLSIELIKHCQPLVSDLNTWGYEGNRLLSNICDEAKALTWLYMSRSYITVRCEQRIQKVTDWNIYVNTVQ